MSMIRSIEPFVVPYREPNDHDSTRYACFVKVTASDETVGWGEAATLFRVAALATASLIEEWAAFLAGTPTDPDDAAAAILAESWWYGDTGLACFARAAIDLALWDIAGKQQGLSLYQRLGSDGDSVPVLLSCHATQSELGSLADDLAARVRAVKAIGIKVGFGKRGNAHLGYDHERDVQFVRLLRTALGDDPKIMIDIGARIQWTVDEAVDRILAFEQYGITWTEEPLGADDPEGYRVLADAVSSWIAYGEREWNPRGYERIIGSGTVHVVGIDPGRACGATGFSEVTTYLEREGVQGNAHAFTGPIIQAASIAFSAASSRFHQIEVPPFRNLLFDLVAESPAIDEGQLAPPTEPGLGVEVLEDRVRAVADPTP